MVTFQSPMVNFPDFGANLRDLVGLPVIEAGTYSNPNIYRSVTSDQPDWLAVVDLLERQAKDSEKATNESIEKQE